MADLLLVFPPQWSPFQPALSLPSLSAWLKRAGFDIGCLDLNVQFYEWLLSDECAQLLIDQLERSDRPADEKRAYQALFRRVSDFRGDIQKLKSSANKGNGLTPDGYVQRHYLAVKSLEMYLNAVSQVAEQFTISPYHFSLNTGDLSVPELENQISQPHPLIEIFMRQVTVEQILPTDSEIIGLSCIGQDQLYLTLLMGSMLKEQTNAPILVGGTIFSRIFERGALQPNWFHRYFDVIVRNEGEIPTERMLSNLAAGRPLTEEVPGIVYDDRTGITSSPPCAPLLPKQIPTPDYDDMPLGRYLSAEITLPLLSSRGCYWGKCEFCHHHMVYGGKYNAYEVEKILESIRSLSHRYGVHHFAFNDEAIPPKIMRAMGQLFPANAETGWNFTGLIKFEKYFQRDDFVNLQRVGFRSLYVGLESASERVLSLMHKNNTKETMIRNLSDATSAGIWMHNFLFFGFPGETDEDAQETYDFVLTNSDIISSFGTAVFVLEHNAPIFHHLRDFGVEIRPSALDDVDVYYEFDLTSGIAPPRAREWMRKLNNAALDIPSYNAAGWVPRELQLCLLSIMPPGELVDRGLSIRRFGGLPPGATLPDIVSWEATPNEDTGVAINRVNGRTVQVTGASASLLELCHSKEVSLVDMKAAAPAFFDHLVFPSARLTSEAVMSPVPAPLSAGSVAH